MKKRLVILLVCGALVSGVGAFAQTPLEAESMSGAARTDPAQAPPPTSPSTTLRMNGTIEKYDPSTRILSLSTLSGPTQFTLASTTRLHQGWRKIDDSELKKLTGNHVVVRYSELAGHKTVESIRVWAQ